MPKHAPVQARFGQKSVNPSSLGFSKSLKLNSEKNVPRGSVILMTSTKQSVWNSTDLFYEDWFQSKKLQKQNIAPPKLVLTQIDFVKVIERATPQVFDLGSNIVCTERRGNWVCDYPKQVEQIQFTVDNFQDIEIYEDHISECLITFENGQVVDVCQNSLEQALAKYDKFVYCMNVLDQSFFDE